jgi:hypothetical protein
MMFPLAPAPGILVEVQASANSKSSIGLIC